MFTPDIYDLSHKCGKKKQKKTKTNLATPVRREKNLKIVHQKMVTSYYD
jgi:hypothetical protein